MNELTLFTQILFIFLVSIAICLPLWSVVWAARDAEARGRPGWLIGLLVLLLVWPLGLILWLVARPSIPTNESD
jgi:hypothetical protein